MKDVTLIEWAIIAATILILIVSAFTPSMRCEAQAKAMGMRHDWGPIQGCMIEHKGKWIPLGSYRTLD